jgi:hypothetical protein
MLFIEEAESLLSDQMNLMGCGESIAERVIQLRRSADPAGF